MEPATLAVLATRGRCCICDAPLANCEHVNIVNLDRVATWQHPVHKNVYYPNRPPGAVAIVCDDCLSEAVARGKFAEPIPRAIELQGAHIFYHPTASLAERRPDPTYRIGHDRDRHRFIQCLKCGRYSYNPNDIRHRYCAFCHHGG